MPSREAVVRGLAEAHLAATRSRLAERRLGDRDRKRAHVWQVVKKEMLDKLARFVLAEWV